VAGSTKFVLGTCNQLYRTVKRTRDACAAATAKDRRELRQHPRCFHRLKDPSNHCSIVLVIRGYGYGRGPVSRRSAPFSRIAAMRRQLHNQLFFSNQRGAGDVLYEVS
jgi:hypothetical protein